MELKKGGKHKDVKKIVYGKKFLFSKLLQNNFFLYLATKPSPVGLSNHGYVSGHSIHVNKRNVSPESK
jgi:hypothetical protein